MESTEQGEKLTAGRARNEQLGLPFDQYQRYRIVADVVERLRAGSEPLRILDVGGGQAIILKFLPDDRVTVLDQTEPEEGVPDFVQGDATALPFEDGAFDYVVSVDTYEHIPPEARNRYLSELRRAARRGVLLAAPFDSEAVRGAERMANEFHHAVHLQENVWLKEHAENGLPDLEQARGYFEEQGDGVSVVPNGYLPHWLAMMTLTFYAPQLRDPFEGLSERLNAFYNEFMHGYDNAEPSYRHLLVALKGVEAVDLGDLASPAGDRDPGMSSALFATFSSTLSLAPQLKALNDQLARTNNQLARRETQIKDLSRRLAQQAGEINAGVKVRQENARLDRQLTATRRQLNATKGQLDTLRQQFQTFTNSRGWRLLDGQKRLRLYLKDRLRKSGG